MKRELKLARMLTSVALFSTVALAALVLTATGLKYSTDMIGQMAAATPVKTTNLRPGYIARPTVSRADDLNVARSVPVIPAKASAPARVAPPGFTHSVTVEALKVVPDQSRSSRRCSHSRAAAGSTSATA